MSWIKKKTGPPAATLTTKKELIDVLEVETAVAVGFFEKFEVRQSCPQTTRRINCMMHVVSLFLLAHVDLE